MLKTQSNDANGALQTDTTIQELVHDFRDMMKPNTADKLKERRQNNMRDFVDVAGPLGVTHFAMFSQSAKSENVNLRLARVPRGPTLYFKIRHYSLAKHVRSMQKRPIDIGVSGPSALLALTLNQTDTCVVAAVIPCSSPDRSQQLHGLRPSPEARFCHIPKHVSSYQCGHHPIVRVPPRRVGALGQRIWND